MNSRLTGAAVLMTVSLLGAGCRQADGEMPAPQGEMPNRIGDISRDLRSVAGGDTQARQDLSDDLVAFVEEDSVHPALEELARRTSELVSGKNLSEQQAQRLAHHLWTSVSARELSQRQVETLQNEVNALLVEIGAPEGNAQTVSAQVGEVQKLVSTRPRRWYEVF
jgi:hypothetical protein